MGWRLKQRLRASLRSSAKPACAGCQTVSLTYSPAIEAVPIASAANQIADSARARFSLRTVKNLDTRAPTASHQFVRSVRQRSSRTVGGRTE